MSGSRVSGFGFRVEGLGFRVEVFPDKEGVQRHAPPAEVRTKKATSATAAAIGLSSGIQAFWAL